jgi:hypothetical protein
VATFIRKHDSDIAVDFADWIRTQARAPAIH